MMKGYRRFVLFLILLSGIGLPVVIAAEGEKSDEDAVMEFFRGEPENDYPTTSPLLINTGARQYQSLNGPWEIIIDEAGMSWRVVTMGDYLSGAVYPETGMNLLEHSFDSRKQLQVPGDWNSQIKELDRYRSKVLYHKSLTLNPANDKRYYLHFGGANYTTDLFVNNQLVGRHVGGYTAFNFDITEFIKQGENSVVVRVDAHLDETTIPTMRTSDFWKYGGLTRDVGLITVPVTTIGQYHIYLHDLEQGVIKGWVQLDGKKVANRTVELKIAEAGVEQALTTSKTGRADFKIQVDNLELWSPESPHLYDVSLTLAAETLQDRIGFRTITTDGLNILLNGKPVRMRGISMHEETILHPGLSTSREDVLAQFTLIKELNANFVRLAHYPHNEHTVKLADEMGFMLWSEVPIVSLIDWDNSKTLAAAKNQLTENIVRDLNRASVVMWSVANESFPQTQARFEFLSSLVALARELDESQRPIVSALFANPAKEFAKIGQHVFAYLLKHPDLDAKTKIRLMGVAVKGVSQAGGVTELAKNMLPSAEKVLEVVIDDPLGEVVDIVGYNQYFGWYYSKIFAKQLAVDEGVMREAMLAVMPKVRFSNAFAKPMIISEFGAGAKQGLRSDKNAIWSEDYQAEVYREQLSMLEKSPYVQGISPWVLQDFRSHLRELNGIQGTYNRKGLVSETGEKKLAFDILADYYQQQIEKKLAIQ